MLRAFYIWCAFVVALALALEVDVFVHIGLLLAG